MYQSSAGLGDIGDDIAQELARIRAWATGAQQQADTLAQQISAAGARAVQLSNQITGAAAGAKAGAGLGGLPPWLPTVALLGVLLYIGGRRR